jgi:uncharacterized damage-inducible protein DinB
MDYQERPLPPFVGPEKEMLLGFLEFQRETAIWKLAGVTEEQARQRLGPSSLTLIGIVNHLAFVERAWFRSALTGEDLNATSTPDVMDRYWTVPDDVTVADVIAAYRAEIARSNTIIDAYDLDTIAARPRRNRPPMSLRWIMLHMIEEVARHCGHMDLIRESIDGKTGA